MSTALPTGLPLPQLPQLRLPDSLPQLPGSQLPLPAVAENQRTAHQFGPLPSEIVMARLPLPLPIH